MVLYAVMVVAVTVSPCSRAVTILTGPTFTPATNAPLAGLLQLTTDVDARVKVAVNEGTNVWQRNFYDFATTHSVPLLGFKPSLTNLIQVTVYDKYRASYTASTSLVFVTTALPTTFPKRTLLKCEPVRMEPGYTLFMVQVRNGAKNYITIMDNSANVVWYRTAPGTYDADVRQLANGDLFIPSAGNRFVEFNMLGQTNRILHAPTGYPVDLHDVDPTDRGTIVYLSHKSRSVTNFPSSAASNAPAVTRNVDDCPIVEISATNGTLLHLWSPIDILESNRITYLSYESGDSYGVDNEHANAVLEDPRDDSFIVSLRNQNAVFKFSRITGQLKWILGPPANWSAPWQPYLFTPVGTPFEWNYAQHAPMISPQGTLFLYDNGNYRACPWDTKVADQDNHSRGVEYSIDETNMTVSQVWDSTLTNEDRLFTPIIGDADWLPQRQNVLVTYGYVTYINGVHPSSHSANATMVRIKEFTYAPVPEVVFDLSLFDYANTSSSFLGYFVYRSDRIPDLYPHPPKPVASLFVSMQNLIPHLEFSADPVRTYIVQASTNLVNWTNIGTASPAPGTGDYDFDDLDASQYAARFYRVVTQ
jgi:arylsulfate sulfotransferase